MHLLIAIVNDPDHIVDILDEFYKEDIKGATVIDSMGMGHIIADHVPFFSRFAEIGKDPTHNKTIFVVLKSKEMLNKTINAIERIIGDLDKPDTGIVFTIPIDYCKGIVEGE